MYGMYVHIKAVTYITFQINKNTYQSWSDRSTRGIVKHVYIFLLYAPIMFVMYYLANWI